VEPPKGARIRFTTDGTEPTLARGQDYQGEWQIKKTTLLRVAAFQDGQAVTRASTHSYLFLETTLHQSANPPGFPSGPAAWQGEPSLYQMDARIVNDPQTGHQMKDALRSLPSLSVVCSPEELFGLRGGLYLHSGGRGVDWEKPCSLEWIGTNGLGEFQIACGLRVQGNTGRRADKTPKHSFRVLFKSQYGVAKLRYGVFPDSPVRKFDTLVLRADYNNAWTHWSRGDNVRAQRIRDAWLKDTHRAMGWDSAHNRFVHLYLNGLYWGVYDITERPDDSFASAYFGGERQDYDVFDDTGVKAGSAESLREFWGVLRRSPGGVGAMARLGQRLDVPQFIDYQLLNFYAGNCDWGERQNWYLIRRKNGEPSEGLFRYYVWDGEMILQSLNDDIINDPPRPSFALSRRLALDPEYRLAFADRVQKHCFGPGALTPTSSIHRWQRRADELQLAILAESARWGYSRRDPPFTRDGDWMAEQRRLTKEYFPRRTRVLLRQLRQAGLYPTVEAPSVALVSSESGPGEVIRLSASESGAIYYTTNGEDPRLAGAGIPSKAAALYRQPIALSSGEVVRLKARTLQGSQWSALVESKWPHDSIQ
jgi:hypothetical protein